jgi:hypothetical protein
LFGVFYTNDALFSLWLLSFKAPFILFLFGADKRRSERQGSAAFGGNSLLSLVPAERKNQPERKRSAVLAGWALLEYKRLPK